MSIKIQAPKGFTFNIYQCHDDYDNTVNVQLITKVKVGKVYIPKEIGYVHLEKDYDHDSRGKEFYRTHSFLAKDYRGKKLGVILYAKAIQWCLENKFRVSSSGSSSDDARRVWKSKTLRKYFKIRRRANWRPYYSINRSRHGDKFDTWYAYEK